MPKIVWFNGEVAPLEKAMVSAADHAHLYGDGLFEGIRFYSRRIFKFDEHLQRLYDGIRYMDIKMHIPYDELRKLVIDVVRQSELDDGYIRLNVTRGTGLGLDPKQIDPRPNVMVMINTLNIYPKELYEAGLTAVTVPFRVIPPDCLDPRIKSIGRYVANILAKQEANRSGAGEGLMLNVHGYVAECTGDNIFVIKDGVIRTPHPSCGILKGITRDTVIMLAREAGYTVLDDFLTLWDLYAADEMFLTGTAAEVIPLVGLDGRRIGTGEPGPVTRQLIAAFREHTKTGVPIDEPAPIGR